MRWWIRAEGGPGINHVRELEQSKHDKWPGLPSAFGPESLITEWEEPVIYILQPSMEGTSPGHPSLLLWMLLQLGILLSVFVNYFCWAIQRLQDCDTHWALCVTYISCCASLFAEATSTCINAASIFKLLFLLLLQDNVFSLWGKREGGRTQTWTKRSFRNRWCTGIF